MPKMISMAELCRKIGGDQEPIDPSSAYKWIKAKLLPKPVKIGRLSRWREHEVDAALEHLAALRSSEPKAKPRLKWSLTAAKPDTEAAE